MFSRLIQKELLHHLLDFRFIAVFALCTLLSALSVYVGGRNYLQQLREYTDASESHRQILQERLNTGKFLEFSNEGFAWNRRPEVLSSIVYGLSGTLGREVNIRYHERLKYQPLPHFESSPFEANPAYALFGVLDLAFIVKVVLSLVVLLFTYDVVCGEKEDGTLRLYASFPVSRSSLALAKLVSSMVAVLVPFVFAFLLASVVLALSPGLGLRGEDWARMAALMGVFALYLMVFAAFGLWASALTHRRLGAFLGLLSLWAIWLFVVPNVAVRVARRLVPVTSFYELEKEGDRLRWDLAGEVHSELLGYWQRNFKVIVPRRTAGEQGQARTDSVVIRWDDLPEGERVNIWWRSRFDAPIRKINAKWRDEYYSRMNALQTHRRNSMRQQQRLAVAISAISPFGAVSFVPMDLARAGFMQQERIENALSTFHTYFIKYIWEKASQERPVLTDFSPFTYRDTETLGECLSRNAGHILDLVLLTILGFAGAYVSILRYDVR